MSSLIERHQALIASKHEFAERLLSIPESQWHTHSSDGGFSPAELMEHLAKAEEFNLKFLRKTPPRDIATRKVKPGFMYNMILKSFKSLKRTSAPPMLKPNKSPDMRLQGDQWRKHLEEVDSFLGHVSAVDSPFIKMNFLFGTLSADQFLEFQEAHIAYHCHYFPKV